MTPSLRRSTLACENGCEKQVFSSLPFVGGQRSPFTTTMSDAFSLLRDQLVVPVADQLQVNDLLDDIEKEGEAVSRKTWDSTVDVEKPAKRQKLNPEALNRI